MTTRPFRFGVSLFTIGSRNAWRDRARQVEDLGYDVIQVADHIGLPAPFPVLMAAADATSTVRLGTYVLNAGILNPTYLARDVADVHRLTDGRLELGLGTGYVEAEFQAAGVPFGTGGERLRKLAKTLTETKALLAELPDKPNPPIMLSGAGDRMLQLGGREADIFSLSIMAGITEGLAPDDALGRRVGILREAAGDRDVELNLFVAGVGESLDQLDLSIMRGATGLGDDYLAKLPGVLVGSPQQMAERLLHLREQFGINYISILEPHLDLFAQVIKHLR